MALASQKVFQIGATIQFRRSQIPALARTAFKILPPKLIGETKVIVHVGEKLIEGGSNAVFRIVITGSKVVLAEQASLEADLAERISANTYPRPGPDAVSAERT